MVLCASFNSRAHSSILLPNDDDDCRYELPTSTPPPSRFVTSQPISLRSPYSTDDDLADSPPMERLYSPLSSSAESISSIKSSSSSRSSAEREIERQQRRQLLDASLLKMRASNNLPLRKHLLVYNTVKQLQRDLDLLDDEELYCNLMGEGCGERMDVDERRWPFGATSTTSSASAVASIPVTATVAPPQQEERRVAEEATSLISDDLDMEVCQMVQQQQAPSATWSWSGDDSATGVKSGGGSSLAQSGFDLFESIQDALGESFAGWSWTTADLSGSSSYSSSDTWWSGGAMSSPFGVGSRFDSLWGVDAGASTGVVCRRPASALLRRPHSGGVFGQSPTTSNQQTVCNTRRQSLPTLVPFVISSSSHTC
ncbi:hypothetical protein V3C99_016536 [Haemonchus contortus]